MGESENMYKIRRRWNLCISWNQLSTRTVGCWYSQIVSLVDDASRVLFHWLRRRKCEINFGMQQVTPDKFILESCANPSKVQKTIIYPIYLKETCFFYSQTKEDRLLLSTVSKVSFAELILLLSRNRTTKPFFLKSWKWNQPKFSDVIARLCGLVSFHLSKQQGENLWHTRDSF